MEDADEDGCGEDAAQTTKMKVINTTKRAFHMVFLEGWLFNPPSRTSPPLPNFNLVIDE